jgi:hypothetical protein
VPSPFSSDAGPGLEPGGYARLDADRRNVRQITFRLQLRESSIHSVKVHFKIECVAAVEANAFAERALAQQLHKTVSDRDHDVRRLSNV